MNNQRRKELENIVATMENICTVNIDELEGIKSDIESVLWDEEFAFESMPENLQYSMRGEASQEAQDNMNEAIDLIDEFINDIEEGNEIEDEFQNLVDEVVGYLMTAAE